MDIDKVKQVPAFFKCVCCYYSTRRESQFIRHNATAKHKRMHGGYMIAEHVVPIVHDIEQAKCHCGKEYKHYSGLWRHKKKCSHNPSTNTPQIPVLEKSFIQSPALPIDQHVIIELLKQNQEFKDLLIEQNKQLVRLCNENFNTK